MLDTLGVVADDRFEALVDKVDKLREAFVDWKTIAAADAEKAPPISEAAAIASVIGNASDGGTTTGTPVIADIDDRIAHNETAAAELAVTLVVRPDMPPPSPISSLSEPRAPRAGSRPSSSSSSDSH